MPHQVAVHQRQNLSELRPLAEEERYRQLREAVPLDREGVGHLDQEVGQVEVVAAVVEPQLPVVGAEADLINRK